MATQDLGRLDCSAESPCVIEADGPTSVVDVSRLRLANDAVVTIDAKGDPDAVIVVRIARGLKSRLRGTFELAGGAQASNVLFYVSGGNCDLGGRTTGAGALFCPAGKLRLRFQGEWNGALVGGRNVDIGDNALVTHVPFTGFAH